MLFGALPSVLQAGKGTAPFMVALMLLALGAGRFTDELEYVTGEKYC